MTEWETLGDDEVRARLEQRGLDRASASILVEGRDCEECAAIIGEVLGAG